MDRNREARRVAMATPSGLSRRRHRTSSHRDSPEDDGPLELQESARFRDRTGKKDRDREKERSERERDRLSRSKRRRGEKYMHREDGGDESSEESLNDDDEEQEDVPVSHMPSNPVSVSSSSFPSSALTSRKSYPPPSKVFKVAPTWRGPSETIGFTIPRRARTASTKRAHDSWSSVGVAGEQILRQASSSPLRPAMAASSAAASPSPTLVSPSSSSLSTKKKIKVNGAKQRPQKSSSKSPFAVQDEIEIEVAEVLYGLMRQSHGSSKPETMPNDSVKYDSREANRSTGDSKSRASSPISNSGSVQLQDSPAVPQNSSSSTPPLSAVAPKRKRPRPVSQLEEIPAGFASRSSPISTAAKTELDLPAKQEVHPPKLGKKFDSAADNGGLSLDFSKSHGPQSTPEATRSEPASGVLSSEDNHPAADLSLGKETPTPGKAEEVPSPKKESADDRAQFSAILELTTATTTGEMESRREEKFQIDLMAPPPPSRSSPEREREMDHNEAKVTDGEAEPKAKLSEGEEEKAGKSISCDSNAADVEKGTQSSVSGAEDSLTQKVNFNKARKLDLHLDLERLDRNAGPSGAEEGKLNQQPPLLNPWRNDTSADKTAQPSTLPLSMSVPPGWPAGLPPMGYAPLQGVVSMDGRSMAPTAIQPPHFLFTQPRPGRCATHCYIAKNIYSHQQFMKNYPFWPAPAGPAPLFGAKPYNLNVVPAAATDLHGNAALRGDVNPVQEKGQTLAFFPGQQQPAAKDKGPQPAAANAVDGAQKKQFYQSLPPGGGPNNIMHGPATLFFPLGQQQQVNAAGAAASARPNTTKSPTSAGTAPSTSISTSVPHAPASSGQTSSTTMSFNYPNMPANETQYLAILANGAYQFPIPAHVGAAQAYRGAHPQVMPFFNGSYYPSQMLHPSRLQQQAPPGAQPMQIQHNQQNPSVSIASSSSQKHTQNQQQRPQGSSANGATASPGLQNFSAPKTRASQTQQLEMGGEGSPSTADSRLSRPSNNMNVYGQNFALPFNPSSFAMMTTPASLTGTANGNHAEKKQQQPQTQQQQQHQAFAMSFASMNGAAANLDIASMAQNHAFLQSLPEAARNNYHIMAAAAAAQAAQQRKNHPGSEDGKSGARDSSNPEDERKVAAAKASASTGQSLAFSRPDMAETSGNNVLDSSARSLNLAPGSVHSSHTSSTSMSDRELQKHLQKFASSSRRHRVAPFTSKAAAASRAPVTSNGSVYSDQLAALATKYPPNTYSGYAQPAVQGSNTQTQSPQWQNSGRTITSQASSPSMPTSMKNIGQQEGRTQQGHTQISFGGNPKAAAPSQGQQQSQNAAATQSPPPPMRVGSPSTSSLSRGHSGSPRMNSPSAMGNKSTQASSLSNQPGKNPVPGRNGPSVLGNSQMPVSSSMGSGKQLSQHPQQLSQHPQQLSQHQLQQPLSKQSIQQAQMFFNNAYLQTHSAATSSAVTAAGGFQLQRHRTEQHQQPPNTQGGPATSSSATANDPSKAAAGNTKSGKQPQGGALPASGFPYSHEVAAAARMQAEHKQTAD